MSELSALVSAHDCDLRRSGLGRDLVRLFKVWRYETREYHEKVDDETMRLWRDRVVTIDWNILMKSSTIP